MSQANSIIAVAKAAGVSTATVSRVLNGLPGVREETVAQVRAAVDKLKYSRLRTRSIRKAVKARPGRSRTGCIAVITLGQGQAWLEQPVMASVVTGIQRSAAAQDLGLMLGAMWDPVVPAPMLLNRQIDGAIVFLSSYLTVPIYEAALKMVQNYAPVVWAMGMEMTLGGVDHVAPDHVGIGNLAYAYLQELKCQRPAFLTVDPKWPFMRLRGQSFLNSAFDAGARPTLYAVVDDEDEVLPYGGRVVTSNRLSDLIQKMAADKLRPDGLFVGNDATMSDVYPLLVQHRIRIGTDMQLISCDAENARLAGMHPRPASIDIGGDEIGCRSVDCLLNRIERPGGQPLVIKVAPRLQLPPIRAT
jgi:DNA-binding LacI/PurR family transcriptional regulator